MSHLLTLTLTHFQTKSTENESPVLSGSESASKPKYIVGGQLTQKNVQVDGWVTCFIVITKMFIIQTPTLKQVDSFFNTEYF